MRAEERNRERERERETRVETPYLRRIAGYGGHTLAVPGHTLHLDRTSDCTGAVPWRYMGRYLGGIGAVRGIAHVPLGKT